MNANPVALQRGAVIKSKRPFMEGKTRKHEGANNVN